MEIDLKTIQIKNETVERWYADIYVQVQKIRIAVENRLRAYNQEKDSTQPIIRVEEIFNMMLKTEKIISEEMTKYIKDHPALDFLNHIKGIGGVLGCKLIALIGDIENFDTVSKLWRYCGMGVIKGKAERRIKGEGMHYNQRLKDLMFLIAKSFLMSQNKYSELYYKYKEYYQNNRKDWTPLHIHLASNRQMIKIFLSHLWEQWRLAEGLNIRLPYVIEKLGHTGILRAEEFYDR